MGSSRQGCSGGSGPGETNGGCARKGAEMIQTPAPAFPSIPFDWLRFIDNDLMPFAVVVVVGIGLVIALRVVMKSPVGEAWAERIRRKTREKFGEGAAGEQAVAQLEAVHDQLAQMDAHLAE